MTITRYDKFAFLPKRCDVCRRLFIWEFYNVKYRFLISLDEIHCKECIKKEKEK